MKWKAFYSRKMHEALINGSHSYILGDDDTIYRVEVDGEVLLATEFTPAWDERKWRWSDDLFIGEFDCETLEIVSAKETPVVCKGENDK